MALCWSAEWLTDASVQVQWCSEVALENLLGEGEKTPPLKSVFKKIANPPLTFYFTFRGLKDLTETPMWNEAAEKHKVCVHTCPVQDSAVQQQPNLTYCIEHPL